jgi:hypothetical protein
MPNYRRARTTGGTYFFTVVTYRRRLLFDLAEARSILGEVVREVKPPIRLPSMPGCCCPTTSIVSGPCPPMMLIFQCGGT